MTITYDDKTPRHFMIASITWGIVGINFFRTLAHQIPRSETRRSKDQCLEMSWLVMRIIIRHLHRH